MAYLGCHKGFIFYCRAKREGHEDRCRALEAKFEHVADMYADFGDIFAKKICTDKKAFRLWLYRTGRLFDDNRGVWMVHDPTTYTGTPGTVLVELPMYEKRSEVLHRVERFLDRYYDGTIIEKRTGVMQPRPALKELRRPKYVLSTGAEDLSTATIKALWKAAYVAGLRRQSKLAGAKLSLTDMVLAIKRDPKNPFGWTLTKQDERDIVHGVFKKGLYGSSEVTLVKRALKDFDAYVRNTIHGRFPDNS